MPAEAGIQCLGFLDSVFRRNDEQSLNTPLS